MRVLSTNSRSLKTLGAVAAALLLFSGCAGGVGNAGSTSGSSTGFAYGASQEEVDAAVDELDPVTLVFQPATASPEAPGSDDALNFIEAVEERSGGKISLQTAWGQSIAPAEEVTDALTDGRIDIAFVPAIYFPKEFPVLDSYSKITQYSPASPLVGEAINAAMMHEWGWNSEELHAEYESKGLHPLQIVRPNGDYYTACTEPGTSVEDWDGRVMRIGGQAHSEVATAMGATPVSLAYTELFEALERGTADCTFTSASQSATTGITGSAPYLSHFSKGRMTGAVTAAHLFGSTWDTLPLAYQQIIFDATRDEAEGLLSAVVNTGVQTVADTKEAGGEVSAMDPEAEETMSDAQDEIVQQLIDEGRLPSDVEEQMRSLSEKWERIIVDELGYSDGGTLEDFDEWYSPGDVDFAPFADRLFEEVFLPHRPN